MPSETANNFITKQLFIEKNIVTYRSLSRELGVHVNVGKNELAAYYTQSTQSPTPFATYLIIGEDNPAFGHHDDSGMDVDFHSGSQQSRCELDEEYRDGEDVPQTKFLLVSEEELEGAKSKFRNISCIHMYSLSPSPIRDAGLLSAPTDNVRRTDNTEKGMEMAVTVGKIVSKQVQMKAGEKVIISSSNAKPVALTKSSSDGNVGKEGNGGKGFDTMKIQEPIMEEKVKQKAKATGKLDFSMAKAKDAKKGTNEWKVKQEIREEPKQEIKSEHRVVEKKSLNGLQRGTKRKSAQSLLSDTEEATTSNSDVAKAASGLRITRRAILSDDEEMSQSSWRRSQTNSEVASKAGSELERSLRAMMDIDEGQVDHASSSKLESSKGSENSDEDVEMSGDLAPVPKPKRRKKEKKDIPLGQNGLKKKRVLKTRTKFDARGYRVTEDYSSYESVEEEIEPEAPKKRGKKLAAEDTADSGSAAGPSKRKGKNSAKSAGSSSKLGPKSSIINFFGPAKNK